MIHVCMSRWNPNTLFEMIDADYDRKKSVPNFTYAITIALNFPRFFIDDHIKVEWSISTYNKLQGHLPKDYFKKLINKNKAVELFHSTCTLHAQYHTMFIGHCAKESWLNFLEQMM